MRRNKYLPFLETYSKMSDKCLCEFIIPEAHVMHVRIWTGVSITPAATLKTTITPLEGKAHRSFG